MRNHGWSYSANWGWAIREENFWGGPLQCHTVTLQCSNHMFSRIWGWVVAYPAHPLAPPMRSIGTRGMQWYVRRACVTNKGSDDTLGLTMQKFVEIRWIRCGPNLKIAEFIIYKFKKIKNQKKYVKKLDKILRLLVKNFFFKSASFGWLKFKFCQICTNWHQILFFQNSQNIRNKYDKKTRVNLKTFSEKIILNF
jgi:hypothetical protein